MLHPILTEAGMGGGRGTSVLKVLSTVQPARSHHLVLLADETLLQSGQGFWGIYAYTP